MADVASLRGDVAAQESERARASTLTWRFWVGPIFAAAVGAFAGMLVSRLMG